MSSDPRVHKPRLPKAYTDEQLAFLRSNLPEFERRSQGSIRGDAKKFALERAGDFIARFGLPDDFLGVDESEPRFREQIYNWFKNTVGRTRRKLEGRPRSAKKAAEKANHTHSEVGWNANVAAPTIIPYTQADHNSPVNNSQSLAPVQYGSLQSTSSSIVAPMPAPVPVVSVTPQQNLNLSVSVTLPNIRDAFLNTGYDSTSISSMIQSYVMANPSPIPLTPIVNALFEAIATADSPIPSQSTSRTNYNRDAYTLLQRYLDASRYFPASLVHAGVSGPLSGPRALQMQIRKNSTWIPSFSFASPSSASIADEMQRIAADRQRRKDHILWARIHAAALELGMGMGPTAESDNSAYSYAMGRAFSEMMARDAVWEQDEAEWVAGICVLRAVIRTAMRGDRRQRDEYDELLRTYEGRWKEIKDEARQALVAEVLLGAKEDLAQLDEQQHMA